MLDGGKLSGVTSEADESTIRRWKKEFNLKIAEWTGILEDRLLRIGQPIPGIIRCLDHPLKRLENTLSFLPALPAQWTLITRVLWWLRNSHPL